MNQFPDIPIIKDFIQKKNINRIKTNQILSTENDIVFRNQISKSKIEKEKSKQGWVMISQSEACI